MSNKKYIARQVRPEWYDARIYFDGDWYKEDATGEIKYACYIVSQNRWGWDGFNLKEFEYIQSIIKGILHDYDDGSEYGTTMKEAACNNLHRPYSESVPKNTLKLKKLKEWAKTADENDTESIAEFLSIITGMDWDVVGCPGYSQGEYYETIYCKEGTSKEAALEMASVAVGRAEEFVIESEDGEYPCGGFFVTDEVVWEGGQKLVDLLAEAFGCKPEELTVMLYDGEIRTPKYKELVV